MSSKSRELTLSTFRVVVPTESVKCGILKNLTQFSTLSSTHLITSLALASTTGFLPWHPVMDSQNGAWPNSNRLKSLISSSMSHTSNSIRGDKLTIAQRDRPCSS